MFNTGLTYGQRLCWNWLRHRAGILLALPFFIAACPILAGITVGLFINFVIIPLVAWIIAQDSGDEMRGPVGASAPFIFVRCAGNPLGLAVFIAACPNNFRFSRAKMTRKILLKRGGCTVAS